MKTETMTVRVTFTETTLGGTCNNPAVLEEFKNPGDPVKLAEEVKAITEGLSPEELEAVLEKATTVFPKDELGLFAWDYQWRGFFKERIEQLIDLGDCSLSKWAYKRAVDQFLLTGPRRIRYLTPAGMPVAKHTGEMVRPLRARTMQGDRVALARSYTLEAGHQMVVDVTVLQPARALKKTMAVIDLALVRDCLTLGKHFGFSQWRSGGWGTFTWEEVKG